MLRLCIANKCGVRSENESVSIRVFMENTKKNDKEDAEAGPQAKEKRLEEAQQKSLGKAKASDEDTKPRGRKISHGSNLRRRKTRCIISCLNTYL